MLDYRMNSLTCFMTFSTPTAAPTFCRTRRRTHPAQATTYLTWSAMIWTALLMEEQAVPGSATVTTTAQDKTEQGMQIGEYSIGEETDENLYGHPEIRY